MTIFSLQIIRERFAEVLNLPGFDVQFARPESGEKFSCSLRSESSFFLDRTGRALVIPPGCGIREVPDSVLVSLSGQSIMLAYFGESVAEPEAWYRTREGAGPILEDLFRTLCTLSPESRGASPLLRSICELVFERLETEIEQELSEEEQLWQRIRIWLGRCFREDLSREAIAKMLRIHPARLSRVVRKFAGTGVCDYIRDLRLGYAEELLMAREVMPIEEISRRCGFNSASYFISIFRQRYGVSPGSFRRGKVNL